MLTAAHIAIGIIVFRHAVGKDCGPAEYKINDECCPMCSKGSVVRKDCLGEDSSTSCIPCVKGTFMDEANGLRKCFSCSHCDPGLGFFTLRECTTTADTACDVKDGYYCKSYSESVCNVAVKHSRCKEGQRTKIQGTRSTDIVCEDCQPGYYSQNGLNCTVWTDCAAKGQVKKEDGSSKTDVFCESKNIATRNHFLLFAPPLLLLLPLSLLFYYLRKEKEKDMPDMSTTPVQEEGC